MNFSSSALPNIVCIVPNQPTFVSEGFGVFNIERGIKFGVVRSLASMDDCFGEEVATVTGVGCLDSSSKLSFKLSFRARASIFRRLRRYQVTPARVKMRTTPNMARAILRVGDSDAGPGEDERVLGTKVDPPADGDDVVVADLITAA